MNARAWALGPVLCHGISIMSKTLVVSAMLLAASTGFAFAQSTTIITQAPASPPAVVVAPAPPAVVVNPAPTLPPPPDGTLSVTREHRSIDANGNQSESTETTYRNSDGVASEKTTRTTTYPPPVATTTTTTRSSTTTVE